MTSAPAVGGILETVVYCDSSNEQATKSFYENILGLRKVTGSPSAYRLGPGQVFLVFNRDETAVQEDLPPHGARGPVHTCFTCTSSAYEPWKEHLSGHGVEVTREVTWPTGVRSFYFEDPAGNVLEIADGDLWPA